MGADTRAPMLAEQDAFEIAMAWIEELRCGLSLQAPRDDPFRSLAYSYELVTFTPLETEETMTPGSPAALAKTKEKASLVRAAIITWYILARCPGYTQQNPKFWKTVFDEYQRDPNDTQVYFIDNRVVTESIGFFDKPGSIFPRVVVTPTGNEALFTLSLRTVFGLPGYELDTTIAAKLQTLVARMSPYFREPTRDRAVVEVCLGVSEVVSAATVITLPDVLLELELAQLQVAQTSSYAPHMKITEVYLDQPSECTTTAQVTELYQLSQRLPLRFKSRGGAWQVAERLPPASQALWVSYVLRLPNHNIQATTTSLSFPTNYKHDDLFHAFVSALPFANTLHSFMLTTERTAPRAFEHHDLVWIAYAIHHPNAIHSSWRHLFVTSFQPSPRLMQVMTAMAIGNNLLQLLNGSPTDATSYVQGKLAPRTVVRMAPDVTSPTLLVTSANECVPVDVCGVNSANVTTWGQWVAVMVPAYGIGYVRPAQVQDVTECPASPPMLTGLTLWSILDRESPAIIIALLAFIGEQLEYLNIEFYRNLDSTTMGHIFHLCPRLRRLKVNHNGSYWSRVVPNVDLSTHPQLEELSLSISHDPLSGMYINVPGSAYLYEPCLDHLQSSLAKLRVLIVRGQCTYLVGDSRMALAGILRHASQLKLLHVWNPLVQSNGVPKTYQRELAKTESTLHNLGLDTDQYRMRYTPLKLSCILAFLSLSTADSATKSTTLAQICGDRALSSRIIQFSSSIEPRRIYFEM